MTIKAGYLGFEGSDLGTRERLVGLVGLGTAHLGDVPRLLVDDHARRPQLVAGARDDPWYTGWGDESAISPLGRTARFDYPCPTQRAPNPGCEQQGRRVPCHSRESCGPATAPSGSWKWARR
jgi:hypothetical protein